MNTIWQTCFEVSSIYSFNCVIKSHSSVQSWIYAGLHSYVLFYFALSKWDRERVRMPVDDDPGPLAAEELGHIQTIENNGNRCHVTSQLDPSQQLDWVPSPEVP